MLKLSKMEIPRLEKFQSTIKKKQFAHAFRFAVELFFTSLNELLVCVLRKIKVSTLQVRTLRTQSAAQ